MFTPRLVAPVGLLLAGCVATPPETPSLSWGPISLTALDVPYRQDFNVLATSGSSSVLPAGWLMVESGENANTAYTAGTGSGDVNDTYSFGVAASPERALGTQGHGLKPMIGALFTNDTKATITSLEIAYTGEQWRLGATGRLDRLDFEYSVATKGLTEGIWMNARPLDFTARITGPAVGALDGNGPANRATLMAIVTGLSIPPGITFGIRWSDFKPAGSDDGLAVDDFILTPRGAGLRSGYYQGVLRDFRHGVDKMASEIGELAVGLSLCVDGTAVRGSYFYLAGGAAIALRGTRSPDDAFELEETTPAGAITGRWSGRLEPSESGESRIAATWTSAKGGRHRFELTKLAAVPADSTAPAQAAEAAQPCSDVGYRMARLSPRKQDYFPRLVRFRDGTTTDGVNATLEAFARYWFAALDKEPGEYCYMEGDREALVGVEYASRDVLSIRVVGNVDCYGPGGVPRRRDDSLTYDLRRGELVLDIAALFKPGTTWKELSSVLFAYQLSVTAGPDAECMRQYTHEKLEPIEVAFHLTADGLVVGPGTYGISSPVHYCEQLTVVPFAALRGLADPNGVLARVADASAPAGPPRYRIKNWKIDEGVEIVYEPPSLLRR